MRKKKIKSFVPKLSILLFLIFAFWFTEVSSQNKVIYKYVVNFADKDLSKLSSPSAFFSKKTLEKRKKLGIAVGEDDIPVNPNYIQQILSIRGDITLHGTSKWKNCIVIESLDSIPSSSIEKFSFVQSSSCIFKGKEPKSTSSRQVTIPTYTNSDKLTTRILKKSDYGQTQVQSSMLNLPFLHKKKLWGQKIHVAVFDGGFQNVDTIQSFKHLYAGNRILHVYDYASREKDVYGDGDHGTRVLACMAGYVKGKYLGNAPLAFYSLFRTEDANTETIVEEYNWLFAAEFCDSAGVDVINSSLGYTKFDKDQPTDYSYNFSKLNGKTGIASFAANMASSKGILVCNSAGNSGNDSWKFIGVPADADGIFSVGAVDKSKNKAGFSSFGPTSDNRVKPTICAMGVNAAVISGAGRITSSNGTSFSSPIFCSALVCLYQKFPSLPPSNFIQAIQSSASNSSNPNANIGYGIPDFEKAFNYLSNRPK